MLLAGLATLALPDLNVVGMRQPLSHNPHFCWTEITDSTGRTWVVKCTLQPEAVKKMDKEITLSKILLKELSAGQLPFDVMRPAGVFAFNPDAGFARHQGQVLVYAAPIGKTIDFTQASPQLAQELGRTLAAIHNLQPQSWHENSLPVNSAQQVRLELLDELDKALLLTDISPILERRWRGVLTDENLWNFNPTVIHGDIADENVLWVESRVSCILGFAESQVGDPAIDFAALLGSLSPQCFEAALTSYHNACNFTVDEHFRTRITLLNELALLRWLLFGIEQNDLEIIHDGNQQLASLAEQVMHSPDLAPGPNTSTWQVDPSNGQLSALTLETAATLETAVTVETALSSSSAD